ncbi:MAG: CoA pyrophosphatase [Chloroflexi bacterium]|nr:CoA pyrophosphatase [Chloroflexota bacterium]
MITLDDVRKALELETFDTDSAHRKMAPMPRSTSRPESRNDGPNLSAVLLLLYPQLESLYFVMIKRPEYPGVHSGQIGLPGGRCEDGETFLETALREANEEIGVAAAQVDIVGNLTPIYIAPSDFEVHPFVGYASERPMWRPDPAEVAGIIEMPVRTLLDHTIKVREQWTVRDFTLEVPFYAFQGHKIWGATAIMLSEFENRLLKVLA